MTAFDMTAQSSGVIEDIYPLTGLQQGMLFHSRLAPDSGAYWIWMGLPLEGDLSVDVLRRAWETVFARHAVLRTGVVWEQVPQPMAIVSRSVALPFRVVDVSGLDAAAQQRAVDAYLAGDEIAGADFDAPTLVRLMLVRLGERRHQLIWSYHHLVLDGWSAPVVLGEVLQTYQDLRRADAVPTAPAPLPRLRRVARPAGPRRRRAPLAGRPRRIHRPQHPGGGARHGPDRPGHRAGTPRRGRLHPGRRRLYVLAPDLTPTPAGVPGELFIGGAHLARGYIGAPAVTAERFVADPFDGGGTRLYRTGDRVRWNADRQLEFLGRLDHQVKIRGYRIEPGEIEAALTAHAGVRSAVVTVTGDGDAARLAAYLTPATAGQAIPSVADLREHLRRRIPDFMIPTTFTELAALPLGPTGKVDRAALPDPGQAGHQPVHGYVAPATGTEELVAGFWAEVLGRTRIGTRDNFFELGGHSLLATQVVSRIRGTFGVDLPLTAMFHEPTIAETAVTIDTATSVVGATGEYEEFEL